MPVPILKLGDILIMSIQIDLTDEDALEFQTDALNAASTYNAEGFIIDITALQVVDSFMARIINETASMVSLLGVLVVVSGMRPAVAITLMEMGRQLIGVKTELNLESGMAKLRKLIDQRAQGVG